MQNHTLKEGESWNDTNMPEDNRDVVIRYSATPSISVRHNTNNLSGAMWKFVQSWEYDSRLDVKKVLDAQKALDSQEGGIHYMNMAIQPVEYIMANDLGYLEGCVLKYISRHNAKNGAEDIRKAIHYCQLILELQYKELVFVGKP